jgi:uncharacterized membrane protein YccC
MSPATNRGEQPATPGTAEAPPEQRARWRSWLGRSDVKQALKTGLAAAVALIAYRALHLRHGYWAVISAIIVMQSNLGRSITAGADRLIGTAIGAAVGALVFRLAGHDFIALLVAVTLTVWLCAVTGLRESQRLAGVTVAIVMLIPEESAFRAGVDRFVDVALGIVVALLISVVWPSRAHHDLRESLAETFSELRALFALVAECVEGDCEASRIEPAKAKAAERARRNLRLLADAEREPGGGDAVLEDVQQSANRIRDHIWGIHYSARAMAGDSAHRILAQPMREMFAAVNDAFGVVAARLHEREPQAAPPLQAALRELEQQFESARQAGVFRAYNSDELLRFYSFFYRLQQMTGELARSLEATGALQD